MALWRYPYLLRTVPEFCAVSCFPPEVIRKLPNWERQNSQECGWAYPLWPRLRSRDQELSQTCNAFEPEVCFSPPSLALISMVLKVNGAPFQVAYSWARQFSVLLLGRGMCVAGQWSIFLWLPKGLLSLLNGPLVHRSVSFLLNFVTFFVTFMFIYCMDVRLHVCAHTIAFMWASEDNL